VGLVWSDYTGRPAVLHILLSEPDLAAAERAKRLYPDAGEGSCSEMDVLADKLQAFLNGERVQLGLEALRLDLCTPFQREVLLAEYGIPRGRVSTYGRIAAHLNRRKGARAVGNALAGNPFPLVIPCHRAVRSDGRLGGFRGGALMKRKLLEMEGVGFDASGRVEVDEFYY
jgi:methylated-DNA-[protein]-cysteine S-methyltransferase